MRDTGQHLGTLGIDALQIFRHAIEGLGELPQFDGTAFSDWGRVHAAADFAGGTGQRAHCLLYTSDAADE